MDQNEPRYPRDPASDVPIDDVSEDPLADVRGPTNTEGGRDDDRLGGPGHDAHPPDSDDVMPAAGDTLRIEP